MKTCVSSYSFSAYSDKTGASQKDLIKKAKELGFDAIEFIDLSPENGLTQLQYAEILREESEKVGLPIANYTIGADFLNCDDFGKEVERLCTQVDIAKILGAKGMRHDATVGYKSEEKAYKASPSEIAPTGHPPAHAPQLTHSSPITYAIVYFLLIYCLLFYYNISQLILQLIFY